MAVARQAPAIILPPEAESRARCPVAAGSTEAPSAATTSRVIGLPGCQGIYYLLGKDNKSPSINLWDDEEALAVDDEATGRIRSETTAAQKMEVRGVEAFEVLTRDLKLCPLPFDM